MEGAIIATIAIIISKILGVLYVIPFYDIIVFRVGIWKWIEKENLASLEYLDFYV